MGRVFVELLEDQGSLLSCRACKAHLARNNDLLSRQFHSKNGAAWLFARCYNVIAGPPESRLMTTGMHVVADICCSRCLTCVGWKYEAAYEESQKYKEGKFILERVHVVETAGGGGGGIGAVPLALPVGSVLLPRPSAARGGGGMLATARPLDSGSSLELSSDDGPYV